jgi:hypothetical protein
MAPSLNQRGELIYPNLSLKWLNPGKAERRQSLERATQAMVNEIGYPRKTGIRRRRCLLWRN